MKKKLTWCVKTSLKSLRKDAELTQEELGNILNRDQSQICDWESTERKNMTVISIETYLGGLGLDWTDLFERMKELAEEDLEK